MNKQNIFGEQPINNDRAPTPEKIMESLHIQTQLQTNQRNDIKNKENILDLNRFSVETINIQGQPTSTQNVKSITQTLPDSEQSENYFSNKRSKSQPQESNVGVKQPQNYFSNQQVVVIGASGGLGKVVSQILLEKGAIIALVGRNINKLVELGAIHKGRAIAIQCDLRFDSQIFDMSQTVNDFFDGEVDIMLNCAGILFEGDLLSTYPQDYDYVMDVNLKSVFYSISLLSQFIQAKKGCIVNVSCLYGSRPQPGLLAYAMAKAGLEALTKSIALQLANSGVRVNCVSPGIFNEKIFLNRGYTQEESQRVGENFTKNNPMHRMGDAQEIAKIMLFLCSPVAKHITGQIIKCDGGKSLTSSGFVDWEGIKKMPDAIESNAPNSWDKISNWFSQVTQNREGIDQTREPIQYRLNQSKWYSKSSGDERENLVRSLKETIAKIIS